MMKLGYRTRRIIIALALLGGVATWIFANPESYDVVFDQTKNDGSDYSAIATTEPDSTAPLASAVLNLLEVKGRSPKTNYEREAFYNNWPTIDGCNLRQRIIKREFGDTAKFAPDDACTVIAGEYDEPYTGEHKSFDDKSTISKGIQIDHVVALSDAWQTGADLDHMDSATRYALATDPLNLLAVDASTNQKKSDGDAATWLPPNKKFRCQYVARQVSVKYKYNLWVTEAEKTAISKILTNCPNEPTIGINL